MTGKRTARRAAVLFARHARTAHARTDRLMLVILLVQWALAVVIALVFSPYAWSGKVRSVHLHVHVALVLGGVLNALPVALILSRPGWWVTRQVVAAAQMLWSALLIHLTGGRIETHFHVFGSLAFLAFYRDWRVLPTATGVVAGDHLVRGLLWPESVYGIVDPEWWRFVEHASWVVFEDVVLLLGCRRGVAEMRLVAEREAALETMNQRVEAEVMERTAELDASREQYRALVETTNTIPWEMDPATATLIYVGPQVVETFGYPLADWSTPGFVAERTHPDDRVRWLEQLAALAADPRDFAMEYRMITACGDVLNVRSVVTVVTGRDGRVLLRGLTFDLTAQKKLELELHLAQKLESVGRLAAGIAHEINTPIQFVNDNCCFMRDAMKDIVEILATRAALDAELRAGTTSAADAVARAAEAEEKTDVAYLLENVPKAIDQSLEGLDRVAKIVRSMKAFAHPDETEKRPTNLNEAVTSTLTIARSEYKYVADLELDLGDLPTVLCHVGDLNQAVLNIVVNAAHAIADTVRGTDRRGTIAVRTWRDAGDACIAVRDTGGGIPAEIRDRIFDPFFTTKEVGRGTGQGLTIARNVIVEKHGGSIAVDTEPGRGTTFTLRIPLNGEADHRAAA